MTISNITIERNTQAGTYKSTFTDIMAMYKRDEELGRGLSYDPQVLISLGITSEAERQECPISDETLSEMGAWAQKHNIKLTYRTSGITGFILTPVGERMPYEQLNGLYQEFAQKFHMVTGNFGGVKRVKIDLDGGYNSAYDVEDYR